MNLVTFGTAVRRFWVVGLAVFLVCFLGSLAAAYLPAERYESTASIVVRPSEDLGANIQGVRFVLPSLAAQSTTEDNFAAVQAALPPALEDSPWDVKIATDPEALLMLITASSTDPQVVAPVANRFANRIVTQGPDDPLVVFSLLERATRVKSTASARTVLVVGGLALGIILGILAMLSAHALRPRIVRAEDVRRLGLAVLGEIPAHRPFPKRPSEVFSAPENAPLAAEYERLRTNLEVYRARGGGSAIAFSSFAPDEGCTSTTANLAWAIGAIGHAVTAVDANLRTPGLHDRFGQTNEGGLSAGAGAGNGRAIPRATSLPSLGLVVAGEIDRHPSEVISNNLAPLIAELEGVGEMVLVDTPSLSEAADPLMVGAMTRAVILVISARQRTPAEIEGAVQDFRESGAEVLGVVLNRARSRYRRRGQQGTPRRQRAASGETRPRPSVKRPVRSGRRKS
ncbi:MAG: tyrosine-protein kinase [Miltoncostaeaceae bacterium]|jgi:Mrp family chromosome partitioning ATPase|nr:tyrosine-protein kinase [Miltoncostaeaceae bacterium]